MRTGPLEMDCFTFNPTLSILIVPLCGYLMFCLIFVGSYYAAEASLELMILLPYLPSTEVVGCCWVVTLSESISYYVCGFVLLCSRGKERTTAPF